MNTHRRGHPSLPAGRSGGAEGNERLTAMTGAGLLILLAVECYTILRISSLLTLHVFLGMLLLGPVTLKAGSVLYRFTRYYTGSEPYRRKGPPAPLLRVIGPIIMLLTACVFGSGIMLAVTGPSYGPPSGWLVVHRISFFAWLFFIVIHVLAYVWRLPRLLAAEARADSVLGARGIRLALLIASLLAGLVVALLTVHLAGGWQ
jgi:succinate dehydrogenase/fumarate reductase cytochrome b subunit